MRKVKTENLTKLQEIYYIRKQTNTDVFELLYQAENGKITRVATYSTKTNNIELTNPDVDIPNERILTRFMGSAKNVKIKQ